MAEVEDYLAEVDAQGKPTTLIKNIRRGRKKSLDSVRRKTSVRFRPVPDYDALRKMRRKKMLSKKGLTERDGVRTVSNSVKAKRRSDFYSKGAGSRGRFVKTSRVLNHARRYLTINQKALGVIFHRDVGPKKWNIRKSWSDKANNVLEVQANKLMKLAAKFARKRQASRKVRDEAGELVNGLMLMEEDVGDACDALRMCARE